MPTEYILKLSWLQMWKKYTSLEIKPLAGVQARAFFHTQTHTVKLLLNCISVFIPLSVLSHEVSGCTALTMQVSAPQYQLSS